MVFAPPFAGLERREAWLRGTLLLALLLGMLASAPVWRNERAYPLFPLADWLPVLPVPADLVLYGVMLIALIAAAWRFRAGTAVFLAAAWFAWAQDQQRGQPWFYLYCAMLLCCRFPTATALAACRWAVTAVYFWGGAQKLNARYFELMPVWFVQPMADWPVPTLAVEAMRWAVWAAPFTEIAFAVGLWVPRLRLATLVALTALHGCALLLLGPLGHGYNWVVWPWNLAMIALAWTLFATRAPRSETEAPTATAPVEGGGQTAQSGALSTSAPLPSPPSLPGPCDLTLAGSLAALRRSPAALVLTALFTLLPALSFVGRWDSSFSFCLYSENQAAANVFVTPAFVEQLPPRLRQYVRPFAAEYDPLHQGPLLFEFQRWCYDDLGVPAFAEPRGYRAMFRHLRPFAPEPQDLRMIIGPRFGPVIFLEGDLELRLPRR
ncbi:MAG: hypothetical protein ACK45B_12595 [Limisphaerales bacterium]